MDGDTNKKRNLQELNVTENDDIEKVTKAIIDCLSEHNIRLFAQIVEAIGSKKAIELYYKTVDCEDAGGMKANNGIRRRTPGGVYVKLLKMEASLPDSLLSYLKQEEQRWAEIKEEAKYRHKKSKRRRKRLKKDLDRPETSTSTEQVEKFDNANEVEVEDSDLPHRSDTPEPKDCSDNKSEVEDDEEEAKAGVLKKQRTS